MWKSRCPTVGNSRTPVVDDITELLCKAPDAQELCAKLKHKFGAPPKRKLSNDLGRILENRIISITVFV